MKMLSEIFVLPLTFLLIILSQYARFLWIYASWRQWIHETTQNWEYSCSYLKVNAWNSILWLIPQKFSYLPNTTETTQILEYSHSNCTQSPTTQTTKSCDWLLFSIFLHRVLYGDNVYKVRLKLILRTFYLCNVTMLMVLGLTVLIFMVWYNVKTCHWLGNFATNSIHFIHQKVTSVCEEADLDIRDIVIDCAHRIGNEYVDNLTSVKCKRITVRFTTFRHQTWFYRAKKKLKMVSRLKLT